MRGVQAFSIYFFFKLSNTVLCVTTNSGENGRKVFFLGDKLSNKKKKLKLKTIRTAKLACFGAPVLSTVHMDFQTH